MRTRASIFAAAAGLSVSSLAGAQSAATLLGPVVSAGGNFQITLRSGISPVIINRMHALTAHIETAGGAPVAGAALTIQASVPGLARKAPTAPRVTASSANGDYTIDGMKFDMAGRWRIDLAIEAGGVRDRASFKIDVK